MARFELLDPSFGTAGATAGVAADILLEMGLRCASGRDGDVDLVAAHMYFNLADRKGDERAAFHRGDIAQSMTKGEIVQALRAAREWLARH